MRAWIFSDLSIASRSCPPALSTPDADVCICAGDICEGGPERAVRYLGEHVSHEMPVILVPGNRDYYRASLVEGLREAMYVAAQLYPSVHVLSRHSIVLGGHRFIGATLWSDFNLHGNMSWAMRCAQTELNDYREIKFSNVPPQQFSAGHASGQNHMDKHFIRSTLGTPFAGPTVVVTHHAPSILSLGPHFAGAPLPASAVTNLEPDISRYRPAAWIHGHIHHRSDYFVMGTRVICNPRGDAAEPVPNFDPGFVVNLGGQAIGETF
ncbi:MAG: metallophosphoesterase [Agrobacterium tumefaciens]